MTQYVIFGFVLLAVELVVSGGVSSACRLAQSAVPLNGIETEPATVIRAYTDGLSGVRAANPDLHLSVGRDPAGPDERVLIVEYPAPTDDPAGRDVQCDAESRNWTAGRAISFQIKPAHAVMFSLSFFDRNRVAYTTWTDLEGGVWQRVRIRFDDIHPNPYFQPPDAKNRRATRRQRSEGHRVRSA
jgi:hypothetical protein